MLESTDFPQLSFDKNRKWEIPDVSKGGGKQAFAAPDSLWSTIRSPWVPASGLEGLISACSTLSLAAQSSIGIQTGNPG